MTIPKPLKSNRIHQSDPSEDDENFDASEFDEKISLPMGSIQTKNTSHGGFGAFDKISQQSKLTNKSNPPAQNKRNANLYNSGSMIINPNNNYNQKQKNT